VIAELLVIFSMLGFKMPIHALFYAVFGSFELLNVKFYYEDPKGTNVCKKHVKITQKL